MKKILFWTILLLALAFIWTLVFSIQDASAHYENSVVKLYCQHEGYFQQASGILFQHEGYYYVETNAHVATDFCEIWLPTKYGMVYFESKGFKKLEGDRATLQVRSDALHENYGTLQDLRENALDDELKGKERTTDEVETVGFPNGEYKITTGKIIGTFKNEGMDLIMTTAPVDYGSSGGLATSGEALLGLTTFKSGKLSLILPFK